MSYHKTFYLSHLWKDAPIFHQPFWLDAVADKDWDVVLSHDNDTIKAYFLYACKKDVTGFQIVMPKLTQFLGPNYKLSGISNRERNHEEEQLLEQLLKGLPAFSYFESRWHYAFQNWLPFYWKGFQQTTRYTYVLEDISNPEKLRSQFSDKVNREINKAEKNFMVVSSTEVTAFYQLLKKNFEGKRKVLPFTESLLLKIYLACNQNGAGEIWLSKDKNGNAAAGIFIVWDAATAYYLIGGKDDSFGNSGAMSQLFWHSFNHLKNKVQKFDFEGSMIRGVENYFRSFGAERKGFFELSKINSPIQKIKASLRKTFRR